MLGAHRIKLSEVLDTLFLRLINDSPLKQFIRGSLQTATKTSTESPYTGVKSEATVQ